MALCPERVLYAALPEPVEVQRETPLAKQSPPHTSVPVHNSLHAIVDVFDSRSLDRIQHVLTGKSRRRKVQRGS